MLHNWLKSHKKVQIEEVLKRAKNINVFSSFMKRIALKGPTYKVQGVAIIIPSLVYYALLECFLLGPKKDVVGVLVVLFR